MLYIYTHIVYIYIYNHIYVIYNITVYNYIYICMIFINELPGLQGTVPPALSKRPTGRGETHAPDLEVLDTNRWEAAQKCWFLLIVMDSY